MSHGILQRKVRSKEGTRAREAMLDQLVNGGCAGAQRLREFLHDSVQTELRLEGLQPHHRALLHNVASLHGLSSQSTGPKKNRVMVFEKKSDSPTEMVIEERLFYEGYLGLRGAWVEVVAAKRIGQVPKPMQKLRTMRDGPTHHITLFNRKEMAILKKKIKGDTIINTICRQLQDDWTDVGQGYLIQGDQEAYFRVLDWPSANLLRRRYGFEEATFHITQGFNPKDIHDVPKDRSTLIHPTSPK